MAKVLITLLLIVIVGVALFGRGSKNPLPPSIAQQLSFSAIYPKEPSSASSLVEPNSISYQPAQKSLAFMVQAPGTNIVLTEQAALGDSSNPNLVYYQSLGLRPVTEIDTNLGLVVLVNFYTTGTLNAAGQNAVLADNGTLLIAHPAKNITPEAWKSFFNSLSLYK